MCVWEARALVIRWTRLMTRATNAQLAIIVRLGPIRQPPVQLAPTTHQNEGRLSLIVCPVPIIPTTRLLGRARVSRVARVPHILKIGKLVSAEAHTALS